MKTKCDCELKIKVKEKKQNKTKTGNTLQMNAGEYLYQQISYVTK